MNLPIEYENRMRRILGSDYEAYIKSFDDKPRRAFHINTVKISKDEFCRINPFTVSHDNGREDCFLFDYDGIGKHPCHHAGMFYVQEPAAMFPVECVDIKPEWNVLDMCAAPGGKSSQTMQFLGENAHLVSNEIVPSRCKMLTGNFERLGFRNSSALCASPKDIAAGFGRAFDFVICDAPCSGEGMFRKEQNAIPEWSSENVLKCAQRQKEVLASASKCVKPGGYLLYSTCTFSEEENEKMLLWFINEYPDFELTEVKKEVLAFTADGTDIAGNSAHFMRRFYPHSATGEGQFAALLRYTGNGDGMDKRSLPLRKPDKTESEIAESFLKDVFPQYNRDFLRVNKDKLIYCNPDFYIPTQYAYMTGVTVGTFKKGRLEPHHQFFSAYGNVMTNRTELPLDDDRLIRYLKGESFDFDGEKGWYSVTTCGCSIGGGRLVNGYLKNAYPRGLQNI